MRFFLATAAVVAALFATGASAAPSPLFILRLRADSCDLTGCVIDLGPTVVSCAAAAAQEAADPLSDAGCLFAAAKVVKSFPPSCSGCLDEFGIESAVSSAENAVGDAASEVGSAVSKIGSKIGSLF